MASKRVRDSWGDWVSVEPIQAKDLQRGDIIRMRSDVLRVEEVPILEKGRIKIRAYSDKESGSLRRSYLASQVFDVERAAAKPAQYHVWGENSLRERTTYYLGPDRLAAEAAFDEHAHRNYERRKHNLGDDEDIVIDLDGRKLRGFSYLMSQPKYFGNSPSGNSPSTHHTTKKSPSHLQRDIDDFLAGKGTRGLSVVVSHATRKSPVATKFTASIRLAGAPAAMQTREFKHRVDAQTWLDQQREIADRRGWSNYRFELTEQHEVKRKGR